MISPCDLTLSFKKKKISNFLTQATNLFTLNVVAAMLTLIILFLVKILLNIKSLLCELSW